MSDDQYTTEVFGMDGIGEDELLATGRLEGNFPGGTADVRRRFTIGGDRIRHSRRSELAVGTDSSSAGSGFESPGATQREAP